MADIDPFISFQFSVDISTHGVGSLGYFTEVSGLEMKIPAVKSLVMNDKGQRIYRQIPGDSLEFGDIVLKRGITDATGLWDWRQLIEEGKVDDARCDGSIVMYNMAGDEVARWNFFKGWPSKISGPTLNAENDDVSIEELTIVHEGLERVS
jgi:phage tail-like protein